MRMTISHESAYRYAAPVRHSIQLLRLTPRSEPHQRIIAWNVQAPARLTPATDAFCNPMHTLVVSQVHSEVKVLVAGEVDIAPLPKPGALPKTVERLSPLAFVAATRLTEPTAALRQFAGRYLPSNPDSSSDFLALAEAIEDAVEYRAGITRTSTTAAEVLAAGCGVCQDHAHLFIACCRIRGVPARYVSGYVDPGDVELAASHAWVDAWLRPAGWVSLDVTHRTLVIDRHCRLAVGRDYDSASPIRGIRIGGGGEALQVTVQIRTDQ